MNRRRVHTANSIEYAAVTSNLDDRGRLLALVEEDYCLTNRSRGVSRWQHPLQRSMKQGEEKCPDGE